MTDWWKANPPQAGRGALAEERDDPHPQGPERPAIPSHPTTAPDGGSDHSARSKAVKVVAAVAGAALVGTLALGAIANDKGAAPPSQAATQTANALEPYGELPAAGGGPREAEDVEAAAEPSAPTEKTVTMTTHSSGRGRTGAILTVTIQNDTDQPITVLASLMQGDGHAALVGEGTLAPGSRVIEPGGAATGTVEFSSSAPPRQVALVDLSGNLIATNEA